MTDIIEKWLLNRIGINIPAIPDIIGEACFDGTLFAKILNKYDICSYEYSKMIYRTNSQEAAYSNLKKLCIWLKLLGIPYNDTFLMQIASKNGAASLRLLYELFVKLENKESLQFVDWQEKEKLLTRSTDLFDVCKAPHYLPDIESTDEKDYLIDSLQPGCNIIAAHEKKEAFTMHKRIDESNRRRALLKKYSEVFKKDKHAKDAVSKGSDNKEFLKVIEEFEERIARNPCQDDDILSDKIGAFTSSLKARKRERAANTLLKEQREVHSMGGAWTFLITSKEETARDNLATKLFKQSEYEKQMVYRLKRCRYRFKRFVENRRRLTELEEKHKEISSMDFKERFRETKTDISEKIRIQKLHKRIFERKKKEKYISTYKICRKILCDMIDLAMMHLDFMRTHNQKPPMNTLVEWKALFIKGLPLLGLPEPEGVISLETEEVIADMELYRYMNLLEPWNHKSDDSERLDYIGYIVHRLLEEKYSFDMAVGAPADLPQHRVRVILRPIKNLFVIEKLKGLLQKAKIAVIDLNTAISYVVNSFNKHMLEDDRHKCLGSAQRSSQKGSKSQYFNRNKNKSIMKEKIWSRDVISELPTKLIDTVGTQFPEVLDTGSEVTFQNRAIPDNAVSLGRIASSYLSDGLPLSDVLTCRILLEYIKSLKNVNGWALVDYPIDLVQVAILEFMLTGKQVPFSKNLGYNLRLYVKKELEMAGFDETEGDEKIDESNKAKEETKSLNDTVSVEEPELSADDIYQLHHPSIRDIVYWRRSEILPKPYPDAPLPFFQTFFTNVIKVECKVNQNAYKSAVWSYQMSMESPADPSKEEEEDEEVHATEGSVEDFYSCLGIAKTFSYEKFVPQTLMDLAVFILDAPVNEGDSLWKSAIDLFGFDTLIQVKPIRCCVPLDTSYAAHGPIMNCDLLQEPKYQNPDIENVIKELHEYETVGSGKEVSIHSERETDSSKTLDISRTSASEKNVFNYEQIKNNEIPIPKEFYAPLASVWETIEFYYKFNLNEIFHLLRILKSQIKPYKYYILGVAKNCVNLPDDRCHLVTNFQIMFNGINENQRSFKALKHELYCRAYELQCQLWKLADLKKTVSEHTLKELKGEMWLAKRTMVFVRAFVCLLQIEADRYVDTMQLILDYASLALTSQVSTMRLFKLIMPKFEWGKIPASPERPATKESTKNKTKLDNSEKNHPKKSMYHGSSFDETSAINCEDVIRQGNIALLIDIFNNFTEALTTRIAELKERCNATLEEYWDSWYQKEKLAYKASVSKPIRLSLPSEYIFALEDETDRALFRISLIRSRANNVIQEQIDEIENSYRHFQRDVVQQYHVEMQNIDKLIDLINVAIEEEVRIQQLLQLNEESLSTNPCTLMFPCPPPPPPSRLEESTVGWRFTISQLKNLMEKLSFCAPNGLKKSSLSAILQDMALMGHELGHPFLPPMWSTITAQQISEHVDRWFGVRAYVSWRELVIFGLDLDFPTLEELLDMKEQFEMHDLDGTELITHKGYSDSLLWFEKEQVLGLGNDLRRAKAKELIFRLFQVDGCYINYKCLLLAFSRDLDPIAGFVKALAVVEGTLIVAQKSESFKEEIQKQEKKEKFIIVNDIISDILFNVVKLHDVIITELFEEVCAEELEEELAVFKGDKPIERITEDVGGDIEAQEETKRGSNLDVESVNLPQGNGQWTLITSPSLRSSNVRNSKIWNSDVYVDSVVSILIIYICHNPSSPEQLKELVEIRENIMRIFNSTGDGYTMKFYSLIKQDYIKSLISSQRLFQAFNITKSMNLMTKDITQIYNEYIFQ